MRAGLYWTRIVSIELGGYVLWVNRTSEALVSPERKVNVDRQANTGLLVKELKRIFETKNTSDRFFPFM